MYRILLEHFLTLIFYFFFPQGLEISCSKIYFLLHSQLSKMKNLNTSEASVAKAER